MPPRPTRLTSRYRPATTVPGSGSVPGGGSAGGSVSDPADPESSESGHPSEGARPESGADPPDVSARVAGSGAGPTVASGSGGGESGWAGTERLGGPGPGTGYDGNTHPAA